MNCTYSSLKETKIQRDLFKQALVSSKDTRETWGNKTLTILANLQQTQTMHIANPDNVSSFIKLSYIIAA
jgi:hypothetical protein